jgi:hypothetical protein
VKAITTFLLLKHGCTVSCEHIQRILPVWWLNIQTLPVNLSWQVALPVSLSWQVAFLFSSLIFSEK